MIEVYFSLIALSAALAYPSGKITKKLVEILRVKSELPKTGRSVTKIIGWFETTFFASLFIFLYINTDDPIEIMSRILVVSAGWIGLKTLGYTPDDRNPENRETEPEQDQTKTRYVFLLGNIINISIGVFIGFILTRLLP